MEFEYLALTGRGVCRVTMVERMRAQMGPNVVMFTELPDNPGMSVTNAFEIIAEQWVARTGIDPSSTIWIEHYPEEPTFDLVGLTWRWRAGHWTAEDPGWRRVSREFVCELIPEEEVLG